MLEDYLKNGNVSYYMNLYKDNNISKDLFKIQYNNEIIYLLCTFNGLKIINEMIIS